MGDAYGRKQWTPNQRAILEAMADGEPHWAEQLYQQLGMPRRHSVSYAFMWFLRHGYIARVPGERGYVVIGPDRTDDVMVITDKGRTAAANLDAGYDLLNP
ncbi:hypothetical protein [Nocardia wallacei]|uniref:hypothetical protein n=1 Tax=Nocardia wallacei TaxID=480035 RepID=UPI0024585854|nr:hypothetical protein [Nocardia wallacei]